MLWLPQDAAALRAQFEQTLASSPELWRTSLRLEILPTPGLLEEAEGLTLNKCLTRARNAMEGFPFSGNQRLLCFEQIILLATGRLASGRLSREEKLRKMLSGSSVGNRDRWIQLTLGGKNGSFGTGLTSLGTVVGGFRKDLEAVLSAEGRRLAIDYPIELMRRVRDPALLFDFESLVDCMVEHLIPTQLLLGSEELPVLFSPAQLNYLGPE
jgi:hypothetical protein